MQCVVRAFSPGMPGGVGLAALPWTYATKAELRASAAEHQAAKEELQRWAGEVEGVRAKADGVAEAAVALRVGGEYVTSWGFAEFVTPNPGFIPKNGGGQQKIFARHDREALPVVLLWPVRFLGGNDWPICARWGTRNIYR